MHRYVIDPDPVEARVEVLVNPRVDVRVDVRENHFE